MLAYGERIGTSDRGCNPLRKIHFFAYVRQDATVLSGELANEENQGGVRRYWIFPQKKSPEGLIFDSFTAHSRDHPATITDVTVPFGSDFGPVLTIFF